jgi:hypothetical protein
MKTIKGNGRFIHISHRLSIRIDVGLYILLFCIHCPPLGVVLFPPLCSELAHVLRTVGTSLHQLLICLLHILVNSCSWNLVVVFHNVS